MTLNIFRFRPISNITPFTYRDGWTYLELLEALRVYVNDTLTAEVNAAIDSINEAMGQAETDYQAALANLLAEFDDKVSELGTVVDAKIDTIQNTYDDFVENINNLITTINNRIGSPEVLHVTLNTDETLTLPPGTPTNHVVRVRVVQGSGGGYLLNLPANITGDFRLNRAAGEVTYLTLYPQGDGTFTIENDDVQLLKGRATESSIIVYGHSYTVVPNTHVTTPDFDEWPLRVGRLIGGRCTSYGNSGWLMEQVSARIAHGAGVADSKWFPNRATGVVIEGAMNDLLRPRTTGRENSYRNALRHALARLEAGSIREAEHATLVNCVVQPLGGAGDGSWVFMERADARMVWNDIYAPMGYVNVAVIANSTAVQSRIVGFMVDGVDTGVRWDPFGQTENPNNAATEHRTYASVKVPVSKYGVHSITAFVVSGTGKVFIDAILIPDGKRPGVVVCKEPFVGTATTPENAANWNANAGAFNSITDSVCAEFTNVMVVDLNVGYRSEIMHNTGDSAKFHPNTLGHRFISDRLAPPLSVMVAKSGGSSRIDTGDHARRTITPELTGDVETYQDTPKIVVEGFRASLTGNVKLPGGSNFLANSTYTVCTLGVDVRPPQNMGVVVHNPASNSTTKIVVEKDGAVTITPSAVVSYVSLAGIYWEV